MKLWSQLAPSTRKRYTRQGVTAARYNAWNRASPATKARWKVEGLTRQAYLTAPSTGVALQRAQHDRITQLLAALLADANLDHSRRTIGIGASLMTTAERRQAIRIELDRYRARAGLPPDRASIHGPWNVWWYKGGN